MRGGGFVVPDVGAVAVATAALIVRAFEAVERAIGALRKQTGVTKCGEVGMPAASLMAGGMVDSRSAAAKRRVFFSESGEIRGGVFGGGPGVGEAGRVVVAEEGIFVALGGSPTAAARRCDWGNAEASRKVEIGVGAGGEGAIEAECADAAARFRFGAEFAIGGEIIPEEHGRIPPAIALPAAEVGDVGGGGVRGAARAKLPFSGSVAGRSGLCM